MLVEELIRLPEISGFNKLTDFRQDETGQVPLGTIAPKHGRDRKSVV